jgi:hypothetical protein
MYILQHQNGNEAHEDFNAASKSFDEWGWGDLKDVLNEDFPQVSGFEVDATDPKTMDSDFMDITFSTDGDVIFEEVPKEDEARLLDMYREFERYKQCYQADDAMAFNDQAFVIYWALVQAERAGNINIRRKDSLYNTERNGRFIMNTQFDKTNQIVLTVNRDSLEQFNAIGVEHPYKLDIIEIIKGDFRGYVYHAEQERRQTQKRVSDIDNEVLKLTRQIEALKREKAGLEALDQEQAEREARDIERIKLNLTDTLKRLRAM